MKKLLIMMVIFLTGGMVYADKPLVAEAPINNHGTSGCVVITTFSWTAIPTTVTTGRTGIYITNRSTNTANMYGNLDNAASINREAIVLKPGVSQFHGISDQEPLYLVSVAAASEEACYVEVKQ